MKVEPEIRGIMSRPATWLPLRPDVENDIAVSCRIRLARNIGRLPFPIRSGPETREQVRELFFNALRHVKGGEDFTQIDMHALSELSAGLLYERKFISREFRNRERGRSLAVAADYHLSVMVNEEDHLRMQVCLPGLRLAEAWKKLSAFDTALEKNLVCAWHPEFGYITSCPSNLGTGMRASVMLHLPVLTVTDEIKKVLHALEDMHLTARGLYGEGSSFTGNLYQISNQTTLGESEEELLGRLERTVSDIIRMEQDARRRMTADNPAFLMNLCARAYGLLKYSYVLSSEEALSLLSSLRLGVDCGCFPDIRLADVNRLTLMVQRMHMMLLDDRCADPEFRVRRRASLIRKTLGNPAPDAV